MRKMISMVMAACGLFLAGCGPDTIFVRPRLDTPDQHLATGHQLIKLGKYDDACREFMRAKELMAPNYVAAYVGLGLALGHQGKLDEAQAALDQAGKEAISDEDIAAVQKGYQRLEQITHPKNPVPELPQ